MNQKILGKWIREVDYKWRLCIPSSIRKTIGQVVLLKLNVENCIEIKKFSPKKIDSSAIARRIKRGRIIIPPWLRNSTSFYFGKKVMIALKNDHCEIWPWQ